MQFEARAAEIRSFGGKTRTFERYLLQLRTSLLLVLNVRRRNVRNGRSQRPAEKQRMPKRYIVTSAGVLLQESGFKSVYCVRTHKARRCVQKHDEARKPSRKHKTMNAFDCFPPAEKETRSEGERFHVSRGILPEDV